MSKTLRTDPTTHQRVRPGRAYWQHKGLSPKGDAVLSDGTVTDLACDQRWGPRSKRSLKRETTRTARRKLNNF